ncbi:bifunctional diguanylate cyclase/phosphodiesterase [uncultured Amphritea sp.]|uniref:putative bifunctional diguanylate cyclase/phosphodiesterase n=1 Tax=uncultured Amphritea sp. TaxID=981605 RepID=UPI002603F645|nr:bifunctional diguanylate cyclase/phosphodiesterase [uncultured Amphritea sp.]
MSESLEIIRKTYRQKRALLIALILIFFISAAVSLFQLRQSITILDQYYTTSVFSMFQLKMELRRFDDALTLYQAAPNTTHLDQLKSRYDILWSRFPVLIEGDDGVQIRSIETAESTINQAFETVKSLENDIFNRLPVDPEYSVQIKQTLKPQVDAVDALSMQDYYRTNAILNRSDSQVLDLQRQLILLMFGLIFTGSLLLLMIIRESRLNRHQAEHDSLTGIPNRAFLKKKISRYSDKKQPFALHLLDLNGFKDINDTLGHHIGDALLQSVSRRMTEEIDKRYNCVTCRLGGDEFAIIQSTVRGKQSLNIIADKIISLFDQPFEIGQHTCFIGASIGSVIYPEHGNDASSLLTRADIAMYKAKERSNHSTQMLFDFEMDVQINRRQQLQRDLREAIEAEKLQLVYQPIVSLEEQHVASLEALLRWNHETYGAIPPLEIIEIAEKYSIANLLGCWVIKQTCLQIAQWQSMGLKAIPVAINISPSMHQLDLASIINQSLNEYGLPKGLIRVEVTEDTSMHILKETQNLLPELARQEISIALDDFGTGLSSLSHLQQLPIQTLKIDRCFISKITVDRTSSLLVKNIIRIGHDLGMRVVAEGIEDAAAAHLLTSFQCDFGQGYLFSKPLKPELIPDFCRVQKAESSTSGA